MQSLDGLRTAFPDLILRAKPAKTRGALRKAALPAVESLESRMLFSSGLAVTGSTSNFTAVAGQNTSQFVMATFDDPNAGATLSDVNAQLAVGGWGDGTPGSSGVQLAIQQTGMNASNGDAIFEVLGSHTYGHDTPPGLPDTLSVIITTAGDMTTTLTSPPGGGVTVLAAPLTGSAGTVITGVEGESTGLVDLGTLFDANRYATTADYSRVRQLGRRLGPAESECEHQPERDRLRQRRDVHDQRQPRLFRAGNLRLHGFGGRGRRIVDDCLRLRGDRRRAAHRPIQPAFADSRVGQRDERHGRRLDRRKPNRFDHQLYVHD